MGDTDWKQIIDFLVNNGYQRDITIAGHHDPVYCGKRELEGQKISLEYLREIVNAIENQ